MIGVNQHRIMREDILVVGGCGQVGRIISTRLARDYPGRVIVAGRNVQKKKALFGEVRPDIRLRQFDIQQPNEFSSVLSGIRLAVVSVERTDDSFVRACIAQGVRYVEVATSHEKLREVTMLGELASEKGVAVIPGAGLSPGLSNILAAHCSHGLAGVERADIFVLLGLGDTHGIDAIRWMLDQGGRRFSMVTRRGKEQFDNYSDPRPVHFPDDSAPRKAYRFNFGDQHILPESIGTHEASTRLCFDSRVVTRLLALAARMGLLRLIRGSVALKCAHLLRHISIGSNRFALQAVVTGTTGETVTASATGFREADATGIVTAQAARLLYNGAVAAGAHFLEQVLPLHVIRDELRAAGIRVWANGLPDQTVQRTETCRFTQR